MQFFRYDFVAIYELLMSPWLFSGNLSDPGRLSSALSKIAKIDRLPSDNSLSGLVALRYAWDAIDICTYRHLFIVSTLKLVCLIR